MKGIKYELVSDPIEVVELTKENLDDVGRYIGADGYALEGNSDAVLPPKVIFTLRDKVHAKYFIGDMLILRDGWVQKIHDETLAKKYRVVEE